MRIARERPMQIALVLCPALAAVSLLLPYDPSYDPWGWLVWGRELARLQLHTDVALSWKPLPALLTAPLSPLGAVDVQAWLLLVRAAGLLALVFAFRLGNRFGGLLAGGLAAASVLLLPHWIRYLVQANIEPVLVLCMLAAADRHFAGRRRLAFVLLTLVALARPEGWILLLAYGAFLWRVDPGWRLVTLGAAGAVLFLWFGLDWLSSGGALSGADKARNSLEAADTRLDGWPPAVALRRAFDLLLPAVWLLAGAGLVMALRERQREQLLLAGAALTWLGAVLVTTGLGYPGLGRFSLPGVVLLVVPAGVGAATIARTALRQRAWAVVAVGVAALAVLGAVSRVSQWSPDLRGAALRTRALELAEDGVDAAGGRRWLSGCRGATARDSPYQTALAWRYDLGTQRFGGERSGERRSPSAGSWCAIETARPVARIGSHFRAGNYKARLGDTLELLGYRGVKMKVTVERVIDPIKGGKSDDLQAGHRLVGVRLSVRNIGRRTYVDAPANGAKVFLSDRRIEHAVLLTGGPCGGDFPGDTAIRPGGHTRGCLAFAVPKEEQVEGVRLRLDSGFGPMVGKWRLPDRSPKARRSSSARPLGQPHP